MTKFSILDLAPIAEGGNAGTALHNSLDLIRHADKWGFQRYWVAEHHNIQGIASSATAVVIGYLAGGSSRIRVGAGGIMLPNHAPLVIAEQFGTLASLYPGRIDLGLGRAPGTDQTTSHALRRNLTGNVEDFPQDVVELQAYLGDPRPGQRVLAVPGAGTKVPLWILGSSLYGAQLAAMMGLPFAFASHFAPAYMPQATEIYRERFTPSEQLQTPHLMLGLNVCAADTDEEAQYLRSSSVQSIINLRRGMPGQLPPPIKDFDRLMSAADRQMVSEFVRCSAVGCADTVKQQIESFIAQTGADELMLVSSIYDHRARVRSFEIVTDVTGLAAAEVSTSEGLPF